MKSVQQGATTIHEAGVAYTVSTSSLTMEVEAVTRALRSARRLSLKGGEKATVRRTLDRFQKQRLVEFPRWGGEHMGISERIDIILNSTCMPHLVRLARSRLGVTVYLISNWILASCQPHRTNYGETLC